MTIAATTSADHGGLPAGAMPGVGATLGWGAYRMVPAAYLPVSGPPHMATRGATLAAGGREMLALSGLALAGVLDRADRNRGGDGLSWWQTGAITAATAAPMVLTNIARSGNHSVATFLPRAALGLGLAAAAGIAADPLVGWLNTR